MRRFVLIAMAALGALAVLSIGRDGAGPLTAPAASASAPSIGDVVADLHLVDLEGTVHRLADYRGAPVVIAMRDSGCPVSRRYGHETARIEREYGERVAFVLVNANVAEPDSTMRGDAELFGLRGPYVPDRETSVAASLAARSTAEVFVIDGEGVLRYRGGIDDQYGILFTRPAPTRRHLRLALDDVLAGRAVREPSTFPEGCLLATGEVAE
jgi:hypothetical protein